METKSGDIRDESLPERSKAESRLGERKLDRGDHAIDLSNESAPSKERDSGEARDEPVDLHEPDSISDQVRAAFDEAQSWGSISSELPEGTDKITDTLNPRTASSDVRDVARELSRSEGQITGAGQDVHHVVPINETDSNGLLDEVRERLSDDGVNIGTDSSNLVVLPSRNSEGRVNDAFTIHQDVHDRIDSYAEQLHARVVGAPPGEARAALESFKADLQEGRIMLSDSKLSLDE